MHHGALRCAVAAATLLYVAAASAQQQAGVAPSGTKAAAPAARVLTGKERLGRKWMDEQRIDNCKVPANLRGSKPRPDKCSGGPAA